MKLASKEISCSISLQFVIVIRGDISINSSKLSLYPPLPYFDIFLVVYSYQITIFVRKDRIDNKNVNVNMIFFGKGVSRKE